MELTGNVQGLIDLVGGGSTVEFEQVLESGEKIGVITIDNVPTDIYAPTPEEPTSVDVTQVLSSGTKIATIEVDGESTDIYAPTPEEPTSVDVTQVVSSGTKIATIEVDGESTDIYAPDAGGGMIDYSTDEQETGDKWIDGKKRYRKTVNLGNISFGGADYNLRTSYGINFDKLWVDLTGSFFTDSSTNLQVPFGYGYPNLNVPLGWLITADGIHVQVGGNYNGKVNNLYITFIYTKAS